jgi:hypothetical protein
VVADSSCMIALDNIRCLARCNICLKEIKIQDITNTMNKSSDGVFSALMD